MFGGRWWNNWSKCANSTQLYYLLTWREWGFVNYSAASHQGAIKMCWLIFLENCQLIDLSYTVNG